MGIDYWYVNFILFIKYSAFSLLYRKYKFDNVWLIKEAKLSTSRTKAGEDEGNILRYCKELQSFTADL